MKVLFVSGYAENTIVHHGVRGPGTAFLQTPITWQPLLIKAREVARYIGIRLRREGLW